MKNILIVIFRSSNSITMMAIELEFQIVNLVHLIKQNIYYMKMKEIKTYG